MKFWGFVLMILCFSQASESQQTIVAGDSSEYILIVYTDRATLVCTTGCGTGNVNQYYGDEIEKIKKQFADAEMKVLTYNEAYNSPHAGLRGAAKTRHYARVPTTTPTGVGRVRAAVTERVISRSSVERPPRVVPLFEIDPPNDANQCLAALEEISATTEVSTDLHQRINRLLDSLPESFSKFRTDLLREFEVNSYRGSKSAAILELVSNHGPLSDETVRMMSHYPKTFSLMNLVECTKVDDPQLVAKARVQLEKVKTIAEGGGPTTRVSSTTVVPVNVITTNEDGVRE